MHEFFVALRTCCFQVSMPAALSIMKEIDADQTGTIDVDEFIEFFKKMDDLEAFRYKVETAENASGTRGHLISVYVFVLLLACFGLLLLDVENGGKNFTVRVLLIIMVLLFFGSLSAVVLLPLFILKVKPDEKMSELKNKFDRSLTKMRAPKVVEETVVETVEIPAPGPKVTDKPVAKSVAVEASRLKHPHLYTSDTGSNTSVGAISYEASRSEASRRVATNSYRKASKARSDASTHSHRSSVDSGDLRMSAAQGHMGISALEKKVWEAPGAPDIEHGKLHGLTMLTGLVDQEQSRGRSLSGAYDVSQYDKARELQGRGLQSHTEFQVNPGAAVKSANFTPFTQSQHRPLVSIGR